MDFFIYLAQVCIYAAIMWAIYTTVLRNKPLHRGGRVYLLCSLVLPLVLPLFRIPVNEQSVIVRYQVVMPGVLVGSGATLPPVAEFPWLSACCWAYASIAVLFACSYLAAYGRIYAKLRRGRTVRQEVGYSITTSAGIGPGTLGRRIFFPAQDVDPAILRHELAHIRAGHRYDGAVLQLLHILLWASPAHWLIGRELKMLHEFEADLTACPGDKVAYGKLLLAHSLHSNSSFLVGHSFFHHPLKRRIMMLQKLKTRRSMSFLAVAVVLTMGFMCTVMVAQSRKTVKSENTFKQDSTVIYMDVVMQNASRLPKIGEVSALNNGAIVFKTVEQMPKFDGNMYDWMAKNIRYTEADRARSLEGRSVMQFTVAENGMIVGPRLLESSGHKALDEEAMRLISAMPAWRPGKQGGKLVRVALTLPIYFRPEGNSGC